MNELMQNLFELQSLEFEETIQPNSEERVAALRAKIPKPILSHYDRLGDKGKKGVALVRNHVCTGCHMNVPIGLILDLKRGEDVCLCGNCGRYLHLIEEVATVAPSPSNKVSKRKGHKELALAL